MPAVVDRALAVAVRADSLNRAGPRKFLRREQRRVALKQAEELLADRVKIFQDFKTQGVLLREYFVAVKTLSTTDQSTSLSQSMNGVVGRLDKLSAQIKGAGFSKSGDAIGEPVHLCVKRRVRVIRTGPWLPL